MTFYINNRKRPDSIRHNNIYIGILYDNNGILLNNLTISTKSVWYYNIILWCTYLYLVCIFYLYENNTGRYSEYNIYYFKKHIFKFLDFFLRCVLCQPDLLTYLSVNYNFFLFLFAKEICFLKFTMYLCKSKSERIFSKL